MPTATRPKLPNDNRRNCEHLAARMKQADDRPLIFQHAEKLAQIEAQKRAFAQQAKAIRQAARDDGLHPWAFKASMQLKRMKPQDAQRALEELIAYVEDLDIVKQGDLFD